MDRAITQRKIHFSEVGFGLEIFSSFGTSLFAALILDATHVRRWASARQSLREFDDDGTAESACEIRFGDDLRDRRGRTAGGLKHPPPRRTVFFQQPLKLMKAPSGFGRTGVNGSKVNDF